MDEVIWLCGGGEMKEGWRGKGWWGGGRGGCWRGEEKAEKLI